MNESNNTDSEHYQQRAERVRQIIDDCLRRREAGEEITDESLVEAYPDLASELREELGKLQLIQVAMLKVEQSHTGDSHIELFPGLDGKETVDLQRSQVGSPQSSGLHVRCPHCHNPIEIVAETQFTEIICRICGSSFSLVGEDIQTRNAAFQKTIGHFDLIEPIGSGSFGTVWKARDMELDRTVAVKIPRKDRLNPIEAEKFLREARAAAQVTHPNIVAVHEVGRQDDQVYIVTELVRGAPLSDLLAAQRPTTRETAQWCLKIAEAMHHAHEAGIVHRDLKPSNIILDMEGKPHLTDFGLAKRETGEITMTMEGRILGTPAYMSPEQAKGEAHNADRRSDIYSLGVILYQMLTGEIPFRGSERMLILQILKDEAPLPRKLDHRIPRNLETICLKCMEKEPGKRYQTAREVADELDRFLNGKPIKARPISFVERGWRWCRRNPVVTGLSTTATVLLLLLALVASVGYIKTSEALKTADQALMAEKTVTEKLEKEFYLASIPLAHQKWFVGEVAEAERQLDACPPQYRSWEWDYLKRLCRLNVITLRGYSSSVSCMTFSPDGKRLASASVDGTLKIWDADSGKELNNLRGHTEVVNAVAFSPDGKRLASASVDGTLKIWDADSGKELNNLRGHTEVVNAVAFSPDGKRIASGSSDKTVKIWDADSGKELNNLRGHTEVVNAVAFSPDGKRIASGSSDKTVKIWDADSGKELNNLRGHTEVVNAVAFSPDGKRIASGSSDNTVRIWDTDSGEGLTTLKNSNFDFGFSFDVGFAFSPDGKLLKTVGSQGTITIWDSVSGRDLQAFLSYTDYVSNVAFSKDGKLIAVSDSNGTIKLWGTDSNQELLTLYEKKFMSDFYLAQVVLGLDCKRIALVRSDGIAEICDWENGLESHIHCGDRVNSTAFSPDGKRIASGTNMGVKIWNTDSGRELFTSSCRHNGEIKKVVYSPDGKRLATASEDKTVKIWDAANGMELLTFNKHADVVLDIAFSSDGKRIASCSKDNIVKIWDLSTGQELYTLSGHMVAISKITFSPNGKLLATAGGNNTVNIWDAANGQKLLTLYAREDNIDCISFSPDSNRLASVCCNSGVVRLWDISTGKELLVFPWRGATTVAFSPDGKQLVLVGHGYVMILDTDQKPRQKHIDDKRQHKQMLSHQPEFDSLDKIYDGKKVALNSAKASWSPDSRKLVVGKMPFGKGLQIVDLHTGETKELLNFGKDPAWSPSNGRLIAFVRDDGPSKREEVWIVETSGKNPRRVAEGGFPSWSSDGKTLFFNSREQQKVLAIQPEEKDAQITEVCKMPWSYFPSISPDGAQISYTYNDAIHILDKEAQNETHTIPLPAEGFFLQSWLPDGKQIALGSYMYNSESNYGLWILNLETKTYNKIACGPYTMPFWSPDGSKIAIDLRSNDASEIWVIETKKLDRTK